MFMLFLIPLDVGVVTSVRVGFGSISVTESSCLWKHLNYMYVYIHTYIHVLDHKLAYFNVQSLDLNIH
jgi:hypothetical protein